MNTLLIGVRYLMQVPVNYKLQHVSLVSTVQDMFSFIMACLANNEGKLNNEKNCFIQYE